MSSPPNDRELETAPATAIASKRKRGGTRLPRNFATALGDACIAAAGRIEHGRRGDDAQAVDR